MLHALLLFFATLTLSAGCRAESAAPAATTARTSVADSVADVRFQEVMDYARQERLHERPMGEIVQAVGEQFLGAPYVAGMLDEGKEEMLRAPLDRFDCVLFIETALVLAQGIAVEDYSYDGFLRRLEDVRYRDGAMDGYCSRLHYFSEWIRDNERRGHVQNLTGELGGEPLGKTLDFMSTHRASYPRFAENDSLFQGIQVMELDLEGTDVRYIPQDRIRAVYSQLRAGDLVAFATHIDGLDVTHTGLVYAHEDGSKGLLHASTSDGVTIAADLQAYVENVKSQIGVVIIRPLDPRQEG
ncbi:MAG: N-acetylmuramoyl-L-alanine amidase-like domain-containing protein [Rhodothermales bacterium]